MNHKRNKQGRFARKYKTEEERLSAIRASARNYAQSARAKAKQKEWKDRVNFDHAAYMKEWHKKNDRPYRATAEAVLGRPLKSNEVVHHIDGDRTNNRNNNLLICYRWYHVKFLHPLERSV